MDEVLEHICVPYGEKGIDIYVYDSSENNDTENVVGKYIEKGQCRLFYVPVQATFLSPEEESAFTKFLLERLGTPQD